MHQITQQSDDNSGLQGVGPATLCDWLRDLVPPFQPISCILKPSGHLRFRALQAVYPCFLYHSDYNLVRSMQKF